MKWDAFNTLRLILAVNLRVMPLIQLEFGYAYELQLLRSLNYLLIRDRYVKNLSIITDIKLYLSCPFFTFANFILNILLKILIKVVKVYDDLETIFFTPTWWRQI